MTEFITITKALSDPNRARILLALRGQELCVCRIIELLQLAPSTVSKHLSILKHAGLIEGHKEGRWMHYRLPEDPTETIGKTRDWVFQSLKESPDIIADRTRLKEIMAIDLDTLTRIYKR